MIQHLFPILLGIIEQAVEINIIHQCNSHHRGQSRETPSTCQAFLHDHQQKVGNECYPYLYLDGIGALSIEVSQREVLLDLFEQQFYLPAPAVYFYISDTNNFLPNVLGPICHYPPNLSEPGSLVADQQGMISGYDSGL